MEGIGDGIGGGGGRNNGWGGQHDDYDSNTTP
jgi:hypothetical protein